MHLWTVAAYRLTLWKCANWKDEKYLWTPKYQTQDPNNYSDTETRVLSSSNSSSSSSQQPLNCHQTTLLLAKCYYDILQQDDPPLGRVSLWRFATRKECYYDVLQQDNPGWQHLFHLYCGFLLVEICCPTKTTSCGTCKHPTVIYQFIRIA